ncbi:PrpF domain-containing protein [Jhaorihella thermophila]
MRAGTSKGVFLASDLPAETGARDRLLLRAMGGRRMRGRSTGWAAGIR